MNRQNNMVVAVLVGIVVGTLMGAGTAQYAYVIAGYDPNTAKTGAVEQPYSATPRGYYMIRNTRSVRLAAEQGEAEVILRRMEQPEAATRGAAPSTFYYVEIPEECEGLIGRPLDRCIKRLTGAM